MRVREPYELPPDKQEARERADRLEWITLPVQLSSVIVLGVILGNSQAMKAAWMDDLLGLIPPIAYLISRHYTRKEPNEQFPYGYYRAVTVAFLVGAALIGWVGVSLLWESVLKLVQQERTPIETITLFGQQLWLGWLMMLGLGYSIVTQLILGRVKQEPAEQCHNKILHADAVMNAANWKSAGAAVIGIAGIGFGFWWADPVAAIVISLDITKDGWQNLSQAVRDIMDEHPRRVGSGEPDPVEERLQAAAEALDWVERAAVRLREEGELLTGEVFVVPRDRGNLMSRLDEAGPALRQVDWRIYDLTIMPVEHLDESEGSRDDRPDAEARGCDRAESARTPVAAE